MRILISLLLLVQMISFSLATGEPPAGLQFSSKNSEMVFQPVWAYWHQLEDTWLFISIMPVKGQTEIWRWDKNGAPQLLAKTTAKDGFTGVESSTVDAQGVLFLIDPLSGKILKLDTKAAQVEFATAGNKTSCRADAFFWGDALVSGLHVYKSPLEFTSVLTETPSSRLERLNDALPSESYHESQSRDNSQKIRVVRDGDHFQIGYTFSDKIYQLNLVNGHYERKEKSIRFKGYLPPTAEYMKVGSTREEYQEYMDGFHRVEELVKFNGVTYGFFRKGFGGYGLWVSLDQPARVWDNNQQKIKVLAIGTTEVVLGSVTEDDQGDVVWQLWRSTSLPF